MQFTTKSAKPIAAELALGPELCNPDGSNPVTGPCPRTFTQAAQVSCGCDDCVQSCVRVYLICCGLYIATGQVSLHQSGQIMKQQICNTSRIISALLCYLYCCCSETKEQRSPGFEKSDVVHSSLLNTLPSLTFGTQIQWNLLYEECTTANTI